MINIKKIKKEIKKYYNTNNIYDFLSYTQKIDLIDIQFLIENQFYKDKHHVFLENNKSQLTLVGFGCCDKIEINDTSDLSTIEDTINKKLNSIKDLSNNNKNIFPKFFGGFAFDIDTKNQDSLFPNGYFILPECIITYDNTNMWITIVTSFNKTFTPNMLCEQIFKIYNQSIKSNNSNKIPEKKIHIINEEAHLKKNDYSDIINKIITKIKSNDLKKMVFSRSKYLTFDNEFNLAHNMRILRKAYPECINFFIKVPNRGTFFGSTPERLIQKKDYTINTEAIAGTIGRGHNKTDDDKLEIQLKNDTKSYEEHYLVVQQIKEILASKLTDMKVSKAPYILKLKNVQHLISDITGILKKDIHILKLVKALHPTPAVAGIPLDISLELIHKYETHNRGWYSGPLGWIDKFGNGDFSVSLRSALVINNTIQMFSGGGIVTESIPEHEWDETELKFKSILTILDESYNE